MAYYIMQHEDKEALIPSGYRHAFLFRDPHKAIKSFYKMANNTKLTGACPEISLPPAILRQLYATFEIYK